MELNPQAPDPWIQALRHSHEVLRSTAEPLDPDQLRQRSYAAEWSIAQVLSHLGSQAEIFGLFLDAGLSGGDPPGREEFLPIWDSWNARDPRSQARDALRADGATLERFEGLSERERASLRLAAFGTTLDVTGLARMRLGEHAIHTWDIAVALDPGATVAQDAVALLIDTLGQVAARAGKPDGKQREVRVSTGDPERSFTLHTGAEVTLTPTGTADARQAVQPDLSLPAEAFIRLVYGRLDHAHMSPVYTAGVELDELRPLFPGF